MKFRVMSGLTAAALVTISTAQAVELETEKQKLSYTIGIEMGQSLKQLGADLDLEALFDAMRAQYEGQELQMTMEEAAAVRQAYISARQAEQAALQQAQADANGATGAAFLAENLNADGVQVTDSGLQYMVVTAAEGASPVATDRVTVHYRGTLLDGTEFDSSHSRGEPMTFNLNQVIPGWTEGVQLMSVGSTYMFWIKPELAYGPAGGGAIPPNSTLVFEVELLGIE